MDYYIISYLLLNNDIFDKIIHIMRIIIRVNLYVYVYNVHICLYRNNKYV